MHGTNPGFDMAGCLPLLRKDLGCDGTGVEAARSGPSTFCFLDRLLDVGAA